VLDAKTEVSEVSIQGRDAFPVCPGQVQAMLITVFDRQTAVERGRRVSYPHDFQLVLYDVVLKPYFDLFVGQRGAVDFLVTCCTGIVRGRVVIDAGKQVQVPSSRPAR